MTRYRSMPTRAFLVATLAVLVAWLGCATVSKAQLPQTVDLQILSLSDWEAQLDPVTAGGQAQVAGAAALSGYWKADRATNPNSLTLSVGDAFGGSPPLSALVEEEPAVKAMNLMGVDAAGFGTDEFDRGTTLLQRAIDLAQFPFLSANLQDAGGTLSGVKPYALFNLGGVNVGVVGIINPDAPSLVTPGNFGSMRVSDPIPAATRAVAAARAQGAQVIIGVVHLGVDSVDQDGGSATGPLIDFANGVRGFALILGGHTDTQFSGTVNGALVVQDSGGGSTYGRTRLRIEAASGRVVDRSTQFVKPVTADITPDPAIVAMLAPYRTRLAAALDTTVGIAAGVFPQGDDNVELHQEVAIGDLITDAIRQRYGTQLVLLNGGSIRASLPSDYAPADTSLRRANPNYAPGPPYDLVLGDLYAVLPFFNVVVTRTVSGAKLYAALENSVGRIDAAGGGSEGRFAQISGFSFSYDSRLPAGARVMSVVLDGGTPVEPDATTYTLATNEYMNLGGDGYKMLEDGQGQVADPIVDVVRDYIHAAGTVTPKTDGRITNLAAQ